MSLTKMILLCIFSPVVISAVILIITAIVSDLSSKRGINRLERDFWDDSDDLWSEYTTDKEN